MLINLSRGEKPLSRFTIWTTLVTFIVVNIIGYSFYCYGQRYALVELNLQEAPAFLDTVMNFLVPEVQAAEADSVKGKVSPAEVKSAEKNTKPTKINVKKSKQDKLVKKSSEKKLDVKAYGSGGGGGFDLGAGGSADVSTYTGSFTYSYPIKVPDGRGGMNPKLTLKHASTGSNGWIGLGWTIDFGKVERSTKFGIPDYDDDDTFVLNLLGGTFTLVNVGDNEFRLKNEGSFLRVLKQGDTWEVTDKAGTKYYFGTTIDSKVEHSTDNTFKWCLDRVEDVNGNYMTFTYTKDQGQIYPDRIDYAGHTSGLSPTNTVQFYLEDRPDVSLRYEGNVRVVTAKRLKTVDVMAQGSRVRTYKIDYTTSANTSRSLISSIQLYGTDAMLDTAGSVTAGSALPPLSINYQQSEFGFNQQSVDFNLSFNHFKVYVQGDFNGDGKTDFITGESNDTGNMINPNTRTFTYMSNADGTFTQHNYYLNLDLEKSNVHVQGDFNKDGKTDFLVCSTKVAGRIVDPNTETYVFISNGDGTFAQSQYSLNLGFGGVKVFVRGDFNGDGNTDFLLCDTDEYGRIINADTHTYVYMSNGDGTFTQSPYSLNIDYGGALVQAQGDFNGDGKTDFLLCDANPEGGRIVNPNTRSYIYISNGDGTFEQSLYSLNLDYSGAKVCVRGDFNGDGKTDFLLQDANDTGRLYADSTRSFIYLSKGDGTFEQYNYNLNLDFDGSLVHAQGDFNGDGLTDFLLCDASGEGGRILNPNTRSYIYQSNGDGTFTQTLYPLNLDYNGASICVQGDFDGDAKTDFLLQDADDYGRLYATNARSFVYLSKPVMPDLISNFTNELGATTSVEYIPSSTYDNEYLPMIFHSVLSISTTDNMGHQATNTYDYAGGLFDPVSREFRGFKQAIVTEDVTGITIETHHYQDQVFQGRVLWSETRDSAGVPINRSNNTWNAFDYGDGRAFPYVERSDIKRFDTDGSLLGIITKAHVYDNYGNLTSEYTYTSDGASRLVTTEYLNDTTNWFLEKPTRTYTQENASSPILREVRMEYDSQGRLIAKKLVHDSQEYITTHQYDIYGNVTKTTNHLGAWFQYTYDSNGIFLIQTESILGHIITKTYDPRFGQVLTATNANGQITIHGYDEFGRQIQIDFPDGSSKTVSYHVEAGNHYMTAQVSGMPQVTLFYDNLGREYGKQIDATDGTTIISLKQFDNAGRVTEETVPYFLGETAYVTTYEYDYRGRIIRQTNPDGTFQEIQYNGLSETIIDANGNPKITTKDLLGRLIKAQEATGGFAEYKYDIFDNLYQVKDPIGNITTISYDDMGRKIAMDDPYIGHWEYAYDEVGNLVWQKDSLDQVVEMQYDELNRVILKNYVNDGRQVTFTYDEQRSGFYNIGSLTTVSSPEATIQTNYDQMGRGASNTKTIDSTNYTFTTSYDIAGRPEYMTYPDGTRLDYTYHAMGHLNYIANHATGYVYAVYDYYNALGQIGSMAYGNGTSTIYQYTPATFRLQNFLTRDGSNNTIQNLSYAFDNVGNITGITDSHNSVTHSFSYDTIYRLTSAQAVCSTDPTREYNQTYSYDLAGNMLQKTGIGGFQVMEQDSVGRPTRIEYDTGAPDVGDRDVTYNQEKKPVSISYNGQVTNLFYDGLGNRIKKVSGSSTVIYVGGLYEVRDGVPVLHIFANKKRIVTVNGMGTYFYHPDHLGSTSVVTDINGQEVEEMGYLPFGGLLFRNAVQGGQWTSVYRFTGQEWDSEYALYNYNARLYNPTLSRFITADTIVPDYTNPQSLNRYSYCINNPLIYVDPTGHIFGIDDLIAIAIAVVVGAILGAVSAAIQGGNIWMGMLTGAISGAIFGAASIAANAIASIAGQITVYATAGAVSGGINAAITGGDIGQAMLVGAISGAVSGAVSGYLGGKIGAPDSFGDYAAYGVGHIATGAVTGGIAAEIYGGDFGEGAMQGAWTSALAFATNLAVTKIKNAISSKMNEEVPEGENALKGAVDRPKQSKPLELPEVKVIIENQGALNGPSFWDKVSTTIQLLDLLPLTIIKHPYAYGANAVLDVAGAICGARDIIVAAPNLTPQQHSNAWTLWKVSVGVSLISYPGPKEGFIAETAVYFTQVKNLTGQHNPYK